MNTRADLLTQWRSALLFRTGEHGGGDEALPDPAAFPSRYPHADQCAAAVCVGLVLGLAWLKQYRPWKLQPGEVVSLDLEGYLLQRAAEAAPHHDLTRAGLLAVLDYVIQLALYAPERLAELARRVDAMTDADLHAWGLAAVCGGAEPPLFNGLLADVIAPAGARVGDAPSCANT